MLPTTPSTDFEIADANRLVSLVFPPEPVWVRAARETVRALLLAVRRGDLTDMALLLTSEAVTNAVNACLAKGCSTPVTLFAEWAGNPAPYCLRVLVHDEAPGRPVCRATVSPQEESGRGMALIATGADAWGVCEHGPGPGKDTWFELGGQRSPGGW
ncbi:ATP-binding protein [Streptomyces palmae]|uniref:ATP-binding protein n=1 Tax=Streptomyces palmae TaxID=1701085 RepID=A0A4Z0HCW4_9ACTN|nr:ATP-binding protein [Streptomyces palmae]TGB17944.1 ATP-binding protein [Streptomyces palmae]